MKRSKWIPTLALATTAVTGCAVSRPPAVQADIDARHRWSVELPAKVEHAVLSPGGVVIAKVGQTEHYVDAASGALLWRNQGSGGLVLDVPFPVFARDGARGSELHAFADGGQRLWTATLGAKLLGATAAPTAQRLLAIVDRGEMVALDLASGEELWRAPLGIALPSKLLPTALSVHQDRAYLFAAGTLVQVGLRDGRILATTNLGGSARAASVHWVHGQGGTWLGTGRVLWGLPHDGGAWSADVGAPIAMVSASPEGLIASGWSNGQRLAVVDPRHGQVRWRGVVEGPRGARGHAIADGTVYAAAGSALEARRISDGAPIFRTELDPPDGGYQTLAVRPEHVVLLGRHGVEARDLRTGASRWRHDGFRSPTEEFAGAAELAGAILAAGFAGAAHLDVQLAGIATQMGHLGIQAGALISDRMIGQTFAIDSHEAHGSACYAPFETGYRDPQAECTVWTASTKAVDTQGPGGDALAASRQLAEESIARAHAQAVQRRKQAFASYTEALTSAGWSGSVGGFQVDVVLIDLDQGTRRDVPILDATGACYQEAIVDPALDRVVELYLEHGIQCDQGPRLDALALFSR